MSRKILEEMLGESNFPRKGRQPEQQQITLSLNDITVSFKFDDTGRLLSETIPKGSRLDRDYETVFSYDAKGNLSQIRYGHTIQMGLLNVMITLRKKVGGILPPDWIHMMIEEECSHIELVVKSMELIIRSF